MEVKRSKVDVKNVVIREEVTDCVLCNKAFVSLLSVNFCRRKILLCTEQKNANKFLSVMTKSVRQKSVYINKYGGLQISFNCFCFAELHTG